VSALLPLLTQKDHVTWMAAAMTAADNEASRSGATDELDVTLDLIDLDPEMHRLHYDVIANGVLWFLHHGLFDRVRAPNFDMDFRDAWDAYTAVNRAFAEELAERADEREIVLVQDYQLALVPGQLRALRPDLRVVHFTHTPYCDADDLRLLPDDVARDLCRSPAGGAAGFHTRRWADRYFDAACSVTDPERVVAPFTASLGPDVTALEEVAASPRGRAASNELSDIVGERLVIARSDRIEPSKNIVRGFLAFDRLLEARPGLQGRVVFVAMLYRSRERMAEYVAYSEEVERVVERVNNRWAKNDWVPILLDDQDDFSSSVAALQRCDVLLVNPLRDGLNLVAKEGPALNRRDGVLCLSREAGAYDELRDAVLPVHPYDIEQTASALDTALSMPLDERATRAQELRALATARTPSDWLNDLVRHAGE